jgi:biotin carboxyl carrier protein
MSSILLKGTIMQDVQNQYADQKASDEVTEQETGIYTVRSPMVGTAYLSSAPGNPPFVTVGQTVKTGDPLVIVEAMKLMNEIESDRTGVVQEVLVKNDQAVDYGQALFTIKVFSHKEAAQFWLDLLRSKDTSTHPRISIKQVYDSLKSGGLVTTDIGTSPEELKSLGDEVCLKLAEKYLGLLRREKKGMSEHLKDRMISELNNAGKTLEDIGTSKTELRTLIRNGKKYWELKLLVFILGQQDPCAHMKERIVLGLKQLDITAKELGIDEEELKKLLS